MMKFNYRNPMTKQFQLDYILYMMFSSYFKRTVCMTKATEEHLFLYYAEMPRQKQYELEDKVINAIERDTLKELDSLNICEVEVSVRMIPTSTGTMLEYYDVKGNRLVTISCKEDKCRPIISISEKNF